jgi:reverse gyrase
MKNKQSNQRFDEALMQVNELLNRMEEGQTKFNSEFKETISNLKEAFEIASETTDQALKYAGIDANQVTSAPLTVQELKRLEKAKKIKKEAELLQMACNEVKNKRKKAGVSASSQEKKSQKRERRKLFKSLGADDTWIPL